MLQCAFKRSIGLIDFGNFLPKFMDDSRVRACIVVLFVVLLFVIIGGVVIGL